MNYRKPGLKRLLEGIVEGEVGRLVLTHKDRLLRFGAELVFALCQAKQVEVVIINQGEDTSFEEELASDVLEIITVFSARLYGSRSHRNRDVVVADLAQPFVECRGRGAYVLLVDGVERCNCDFRRAFGGPGRGWRGFAHGGFLYDETFHHRGG